MNPDFEEKIRTICRSARDYLETNPIVFGSHSPFPRGWCGDACRYLQKQLQRELGIEARICTGEMYEAPALTKNNHAWLECGDYFIDITADQFNPEGYGNPPVMVTTDSSFHDLFKFRKKS